MQYILFKASLAPLVALFLALAVIVPLAINEIVSWEVVLMLLIIATINIIITIIILLYYFEKEKKMKMHRPQVGAQLGV